MTQLHMDRAEPVWSLGECIAKARSLISLNQEEFGQLIGVSGSLVSKWEKGVREPKLSDLRNIEAVTPVPEGWLLRAVPAGAGKRSPSTQAQRVTGWFTEAEVDRHEVLPFTRRRERRQIRPLIYLGGLRPAV